MNDGPRDVGPGVPWREYVRDLVVLFALTTAALCFLVGPAIFQLHEPVPYSGDGMSHGFVVKTIIDVGFYPVHSPFVGAPFGADLFDYPFSDSLNFLLIKLFALFSQDWVVVANLFYLAGFYLTGATAYIVMRRLGVATLWALPAALLFILLPYHFLRRGHLLLASYATVPLGIWLAHIAWQGAPIRLRPVRRPLACALVVAAVGSGGVYYAFFSAFLVAVAGIGRILASRAIRGGIPALILALGIVAVVGVNVSPSLAYRMAHGSNPEVAVRSPADSETYGVRLTQLVMPHAQHRVAAFRALAERYAQQAPFMNENVTASLGTAATCGLLVLALVALGRLAGTPGNTRLLPFLATMAFACLMLGTIGGGGALFAYLVSPMIRGYNRISVFIAFVSLAGAAAALQAYFSRSGGSRWRSWAPLAAILLALLGAVDQTPREYPMPNDPSFASDRAFVAAAESSLPAGTMVWQLPYQPFPESGDIEKMHNYGPLRGYLNGRTLRWSYGGMKGRSADHWTRSVASQPIAEQLDLVARSGFGAVYVDRRGFADRGAKLEALLRDKLGPPLAQSNDGLLVMYRLTPTGTSPLPLADVLPPIDTPILFDVPGLTGPVAALAGMSGWEPWGRWTDGPLARIKLLRDLPPRFTLRVETAMAMPPSVDRPITVRIAGVTRTFQVGAGKSQVDIPFEIAGPASEIEIDIPEPRSPQELGLNDDRRQLGIGIRSLAIAPAAAR